MRSARERTTSVYVTHNLHEALGLADGSACCRGARAASGDVAIPLPRDERDCPARGTLLALHEELWSLIREEAAVAEREMQHA